MEVLKRGVLSTDDNVRHKREIRVTPCWPVDRADHRSSYGKQTVHHLQSSCLEYRPLKLPVRLEGLRQGGEHRRRISVPYLDMGEITWLGPGTGELVTRPCHYDYTIRMILRNRAKGEGGLLIRLQTPPDRAVICMESYFQNSVLAAHV